MCLLYLYYRQDVRCMVRTINEEIQKEINAMNATHNRLLRLAARINKEQVTVSHPKADYLLKAKDRLDSVTQYLLNARDTRFVKR